MARIDVHHHLVAPHIIPQLREWGVLTPHLASIMNEKDALEDMDKAGVTLAVNSATLPEQAKGEARRAYSRENNDYMARLVRRLSRPLRPFRQPAAARCRRRAERDRIRFRCPQMRRRASHHEL